MIEKLAIPMNRIQAYSITHLLLVITIVIASLCLVIVCRKYVKHRSKVIYVCGIILILFEIIKEPLLTYVRGGAYSWSDFPFQLCSVTMYLSVLYKPFPKLRNKIENFIIVYGFIGAVVAFAIPYSSFYSYIILTLQSLTWHGILLFMSLYLLAEKQNELKTEKFISTGVMYLIVACIAVIINVAFYKISDGTCNMFFFGPGNPDVDILNMIEDKWGWIVETLIMIAASEFAGFIVWKGIKRFINARD